MSMARNSHPHLLAGTSFVSNGIPLVAGCAPYLSSPCRIYCLHGQCFLSCILYATYYNNPLQSTMLKQGICLKLWAAKVYKVRSRLSLASSAISTQFGDPQKENKQQPWPSAPPEYAFSDRFRAPAISLAIQGGMDES